MIKVIHARTSKNFDQVRALMRAFVEWHREEHPDDLKQVDSYFGSREFEEELSSLPGKYSPPGGRLLLALLNGKTAGCVAMRELNMRSCEMKRMFIYPQFQGLGVGRTLSDAIVREARSIGYSTMYLNTSKKQAEAQGLYHSLGFRNCEPYYDLPEDLRKWLVFMKLSIKKD